MCITILLCFLLQFKLKKRSAVVHYYALPLLKWTNPPKQMHFSILNGNKCKQWDRGLWKAVLACVWEHHIVGRKPCNPYFGDFHKCTGNYFGMLFWGTERHTVNWEITKEKSNFEILSSAKLNYISLLSFWCFMSELKFLI